MDSKRVLVLFYDQKDRERKVRSGKTLEEEVERGFAWADLDYDLRTASPQHEGWLVRACMNAKKYDAIVSAGGLSCSLDLARIIIEELYDRETVHISPRDWKEVKARKEGSEIVLSEYGDETITIEENQPSLYFRQERPVPIIGLPTSDDVTEGVVAFSSMVMSGRPSSAACVGVDQGYAVGQLVSGILNNSWTGIQFAVDRMQGPAYNLACAAVELLDKEFRPYEDGRVHFSVCPHDELKIETLPVVFYENFSELRDIACKHPFIIGVHIPSGRLDFTEFVRNTHGLENVVHTRPGVGENAAIFAIQCLYFSNPSLKPSRFVALRRQKSLPHVKAYLELNPTG